MESEKIVPAYLAPEVELVVVRVEAGFAESNNGNEGMGDVQEEDPWS